MQTLEVTPSVRSDGDCFHDCLEDQFSLYEGSRPNSPRTSCSGVAKLHVHNGHANGSPALQHALGPGPPNGLEHASPGASPLLPQQQQQPPAANSQAPPPDIPGGISDTSEEPPGLPGGGGPVFSIASCLTMLGGITSPSPKEAEAEPQQQRRRLAKGLGTKPEAGSTFKRLPHPDAAANAREQWDSTTGCTFMVRSLDYMRTRQKVASQEAIYQLIGADLFSFDAKQTHVAKLVHLPAPLPQSHTDPHIPPLLVVNIMLPLYAPAFFGGTSDGSGHSIVYYFSLPENFHPDQLENQKAVGLLRRFVQNGREADGSPTRDRLKLIPRIVNTEEWAAKGPLTTAEYRLLVNYNDKPILTRPQQHFYHGHNYIEVDLDLHQYAFLARKALMSFLSRLKETVFENALVLQGNAADELPEQVLCCTRLYRVDFEQMRPYTASPIPAASPPQHAQERVHEEEEEEVEEVRKPAATNGGTPIAAC